MKTNHVLFVIAFSSISLFIVTIILSSRITKLERNQDRMMVIHEKTLDILSFINTNVVFKPNTPEMK